MSDEVRVRQCVGERGEELLAWNTLERQIGYKDRDMEAEMANEKEIRRIMKKKQTNKYR